MPRVGFEPTISADERPKTYALDRAATGTGHFLRLVLINEIFISVLRVPYFIFVNNAEIIWQASKNIGFWRKCR